MFGTLRPHTCRVGCDRRHEYEALYCGLCKSLGDHFGTLSRGLLSYDAVFLALVADGLVEVEAAPDRCRCPLLPVTFRPTVRPDSTAMRYAAAMQMLLCDQWLADRAADGRRAARTARPLLSGKVQTAQAILGELGISLADLDGFEDRQARCEVPGETGPREAAEPTAGALALVFGRMALLPGIAPAAATPEARAALEAFGRHLGVAIYTIDALDDLEKDHGAGAYNPCLVRGRAGLGVAWTRIEATWGLLHDSLAALAELVEALPLRRHRDLVRSVVGVELPMRARAAAKRAHAHTHAEQERARSARRGGGWAYRAAAAMATVFVFLWVWLSSLPALARGPKRPGDAGAAGANDPGRGGGTAPPVWEPRLPAAPPASSGTAKPDPAPPPANTAAPRPSSPGGVGPSAPGRTPGGAPGTTPGGTPGATPGATPGPGTPATPGGECSNPCSGCSNPCSGCSNPCNGCGSCCDVCKGGDCCKGCGGSSGCCCK